MAMQARIKGAASGLHSSQQNSSPADLAKDLDDDKNEFDYAKKV